MSAEIPAEAAEKCTEGILQYILKEFLKQYLEGPENSLQVIIEDFCFFFKYQGINSVVISAVVAEMFFEEIIEASPGIFLKES